MRIGALDVLLLHLGAAQVRQAVWTRALRGSRSDTDREREKGGEDGEGTHYYRSIVVVVVKMDVEAGTTVVLCGDALERMEGERF